MSIATELQNLNDNILDAYTAVGNKGGTVPANKNMTNLPTAVSSIPSGGGVGVPRVVSASGEYRIPTSSDTQYFSFSLPSDATNVGLYALDHAFYSCNALTSVDLSSLTAVNGDYAFSSAFYYCRNLTSADLSSLATLRGSNAFSYAFYGCSALTSIDLSSLTTVNGMSALYNAFYGCSALTSIDISSLTTVSGMSAFGYAFAFCSGLTSINFSSLATLRGSNAFNTAFRGCTSLTSVSFPALTASSFGTRKNQFDHMLTGCSGVTVHFPASIQSTIGSWSSVTSGFSGTNTTVLFDL